MSDSGIEYKGMAFSEGTKRQLRRQFQANAIKLQQVHDDFPYSMFVGWTGLNLLGEVIDWATASLPAESFWTDIDWDGAIEIRTKTEDQLMLCKLRFGGNL